MSFYSELRLSRDEKRSVILGVASSIIGSIITLYLAQNFVAKRAASAAVAKYAKQQAIPTKKLGYAQRLDNILQKLDMLEKRMDSLNVPRNTVSLKSLSPTVPTTPIPNRKDLYSMS